MKLYIIPIQSRCNANCTFCITRYRQESGWGETLDLSSFDQIKNLNIEKIEITGGGEPLLHPQINEIIQKSCVKIFTQLYTNGKLLNRLSSNSFDCLSKLCISRAHFDPIKNQKLMGIDIRDQDLIPFIKKVKTKFSLVLTLSGISTYNDVLKYIDWVSSVGGQEVVIRRMFLFNYPSSIKNETNIDLDKIIDQLKSKFKVESETDEKIFFIIHKIPVEIELRSCDCELNHPILRPNGKLYFGWGKNEYNSKNT